MEVRTLDYHTAGEPLRIVLAGVPPIPGETMLAKRQALLERFDEVRRFLVWEPRGHADMYGALLTDPVTADGDCGVLFVHNEGSSTMCGHGIIALATAAAERGIVPMAEPDRLRIDTPAGRIEARVHRAGESVQGVSFDNVPAFVADEAVRLTWNGRPLQAALAYGGAWYLYVEAAAVGLPLQPDAAVDLIAAGRALKAQALRLSTPRHPLHPGDGDFLYGVIFYAPGEQGEDARNVCVFADGELDRSPTGTGVSGWAALEWQRGRLLPGGEQVISSIIGSRFTVRCLEETRLGALRGIHTRVSGQAFMTGEHRFVSAPGDPLAGGFLLR